MGRVAVRLQNRCHDPASSAPTMTYDDGDPRLTDLLTELDRESPELARVVRAWPALPPGLESSRSRDHRNRDPEPKCNAMQIDA